MDEDFKLDEAFAEIDKLSKKTHELICKSRELVATLDDETRLVKKHISKIKQILGFEEKQCPICCERNPNYCIDRCHHLFCRQCASRMLNVDPRQCFVCRQAVHAMFKVYV